MSSNNDLIKHLSFVYKLCKTGQEMTNSIANCYGQLIDSYKNGSMQGLIKANKSVYSCILNKDIIAYITYAYKAGSISSIIEQYPNIKDLLNPSSNYYITNIIKEIPDLSIPDLIEDITDLYFAIDSFGLAIASEDDYDEQYDSEEVDDNTMNVLNNSVFSETPDETEQEDTNEADTNEAEAEADSDEYEDNESNTNEAEADSDNDYEDNESDLIEKLRTVWGEQLCNITKSIMESYRDLYEAGYSLVSPAGILTNMGIIKSTSNSNNISTTGDAVTNMKLYNKILELTGDQFTYFSQHNEEFDINLAMSMSQPLILTDFHIRNIFGHFSFCTGKYSLRRYITKHNIKNNSETKMVKYRDMEGYILENVERLFYESYIKMGITNQISPEAIDKVDKINAVISRCLKNVIVVAERKQNVNTRLKICSDRALNIDNIASSLAKSLNIGTASSISVKVMEEPRNGIYDINIIYNEKSYSQDALFAYQVLDILEEQNIRPSWDNVILGKKDNGNIMTYNFKSTQNPIYGLYAGSRSGKGVMTLNLLASAMADGCKIFYVDGKPEMSCVLADLTWKNGLDTFAFNGVDNAGSYTLEGRGNSIRTVDRFYSRKSIPENIFKSEDDIERFMLTVQYLRGIELTMKIAKDRMDKCKPDDWIVAVFDECEQYAAQEKIVNDALNKAYEARKKAIDPDDPKGTKKINITKDPAAIFIDNYREWTDRLKSDFITCVKSAFGKGNITVFFVWQSSKFPARYPNSTLATLVESARGKMVKILGKEAVEQSGSSDFGNKTTLNEMPWYDDRFSGKTGGYFAIGHSITGSMTVFRPFNVYSDANNKDLIVTNAKSAGLSEKDLYGVSLNPDGTVIPEIGFEGYVTKLLKRFNISPAQQLNIGFRYADDFVRSHGLANGLLEYIYNSDTFNEGRIIDNGDELYQRAGIKLDNTNNTDNSHSESNKKINFEKKPNIDLDSGDDINFGVPNRENYTTAKPKINAYEEDIIKRAKEAKNQNLYGNQPNSEYDWDNMGDYTSDGWESGDLDYDKQQSEEWETIKKSRNTVNPNPEEVNNGASPVFEYGKGRDSGVTFFTSSKTAYILNLNASNSYVVTAKDHRSPAKSAKLMEFFQGTKYELKSRWKSILDAIASKQDPRTVTHVTLFNDALVFNKRQVAAIGLIGGPDGVEVRDIVNFTMLSKRFKNIREMKIDTEIYNSAYLELGDYPEAKIFNLFPNMIRLTVWMPGYSEPPVVYDRQSMNNAEAHSKMEEINSRNKLKQQMDVMAASYNPRFNGLSSVQKTRIVNGSKNLTSAGWNKCKQSFSKDHYLRGTIAGMFTIGAGIVTLGIGSAFKLGEMFKRR